jgi:serine-type D-Ala-D-Ala carboxypeptidase (penicillin-binding protein 5/6)
VLPERKSEMKPVYFVAAACAAVGLPASAAAPIFQSKAPVAYMVDLTSGAVLYSKDADRRIPPASMAKMMTVYLAFDLIAQGKFSLTEKFPVSSATWEKWHGPEAGSTMFLSPGESVSVENLLHGIVTLSGNDACIVLAEGMFGSEAAFVDQMNATAKKLGLKSTQYGTANGWPDGGKTFTTARDLAALGRATIDNHPKLYKAFYGKRDFTWGKTRGGAGITQQNRNPLLGAVPGADGIKTGHTDEAGFGFTGSAEQSGRRLVMVVAGIDSFANRITESVKFMEWGFSWWASKPLIAAGKHVGSADVQMGYATSVGLIAPRDIAVTLPVGTSDTVKVSIVYQGPVKAPIKKGQHIADLSVVTASTGPQLMPLVAENDVSEAGFFGRVWVRLLSFF